MSLYPKKLLLMSVKMIFILEKWQSEKPWPFQHEFKELDLVMVAHTAISKSYAKIS